MGIFGKRTTPVEHFVNSAVRVLLTRQAFEQEIPLIDRQIEEARTKLGSCYGAEEKVRAATQLEIAQLENRKLGLEEAVKYGGRHLNLSREPMSRRTKHGIPELVAFSLKDERTWIGYTTPASLRSSSEFAIRPTDVSDRFGGYYGYLENKLAWRHQSISFELPGTIPDEVKSKVSEAQEEGLETFLVGQPSNLRSDIVDGAWNTTEFEISPHLLAVGVDLAGQLWLVASFIAESFDTVLLCAGPPSKQLQHAAGVPALRSTVSLVPRLFKANGNALQAVAIPPGETLKRAFEIGERLSPEAIEDARESIKELREKESRLLNGGSSHYLGIERANRELHEEKLAEVQLEIRRLENSCRLGQDYLRWSPDPLRWRSHEGWPLLAFFDPARTEFVIRCSHDRRKQSWVVWLSHWLAYAGGIEKPALEEPYQNLSWMLADQRGGRQRIVYSFKGALPEGAREALDTTLSGEGIMSHLRALYAKETGVREPTPYILAETGGKGRIDLIDNGGGPYKDLCGTPVETGKVGVIFADNSGQLWILPELFGKKTEQLPAAQEPLLLPA